MSGPGASGTSGVPDAAAPTPGGPAATGVPATPSPPAPHGVPTTAGSPGMPATNGAPTMAGASPASGWPTAASPPAAPRVSDVSGTPGGSAGRRGPRTLVAGLGNIFLGDDAFGVEAVRELLRRPLPEGVSAVDIGVRGVHLAYQILDGYDTVVLLDATARGGVPGTVYRIDDAAPRPGQDGAVLVDGHRMTPDAVLTLLDTLVAGTGGSRPGRVLVVGCEPACLDEGIGLSDPVGASVGKAVDVVLDLLRDERERQQALTAPGEARR